MNSFLDSGLDPSASKRNFETNRQTIYWRSFVISTIYKDISEYEVIQDASGSDLETTKTKLLLNKSVTKLNVEDHTVTLNDGSVIYYHKVFWAYKVW